MTDSVSIVKTYNLDGNWSVSELAALEAALAVDRGEILSASGYFVDANLERLIGDDIRLHATAKRMRLAGTRGRRSTAAPPAAAHPSEVQGTRCHRPQLVATRSAMRMPVRPPSSVSVAI